MLEVIKPGLETSVQDYPGRIGFWNQGFPPSGPMDSWSFRLANLLVGNEAGAAGLECQYIGPTLKFQRDGVIAVTGADMQPKLDGQPVPMWESVAVKAGQTLALTFAKIGARTYIAIAGGIDTPPWLGSRSTFHKAGVGGMDGHALKKGQVVPVGQGRGHAGPPGEAEVAGRSSRTDKTLDDRGGAPARTTTGSTRPATSASCPPTGSCRRRATAPASASRGRTGPSPRRPTRRRRRTAPSRRTSSTRAIRSAPSTSPARRRSSWSMTGRAWAASSIPTRCRRRASGSSGSPSPARSTASRRSASTRRRRCAGSSTPSAADRASSEQGERHGRRSRDDGARQRLEGAGQARRQGERRRHAVHPGGDEDRGAAQRRRAPARSRPCTSPKARKASTPAWWRSRSTERAQDLATRTRTESSRWLSSKASRMPTLADALWSPAAGSNTVRGIVLAVIGSILLTISAKIQVPFWPVPMTMQTFVVLVLGRRLWLAAGGRRPCCSTSPRGRSACRCSPPAAASPTWPARPAAISSASCSRRSAVGWLAERGWDRSVPSTLGGDADRHGDHFRLRHRLARAR